MALSAINQVRTLVNDLNAPQFLTDDQVQFFLDYNNGEILLAAAMAADAIAAKYASTASSVKIGDYSISNKTNEASYSALAKEYRDLCYNTPAFAIAEQNVSIFATYELVRNRFLKGLPNG